ncbi:MAG: NAD(P)-dependent dehydrogenase (short-subunit alcohol dehydrogenase family) [Gammaproteobacteria bacterium]|jgi:NAD(P)-dependent dehydrogenase (short-subunit alcohol dehydrogenase family)
MSGTMLKDKVILVTGAGRGIGRDISLLAASQGAKVVVNDIGGTPKGEGADRTPAMEVVAEIIDAGGEAVANYDSVADFDAAHNMVEQATSTFGRLDGVVNNAGILRDVIFHKMTEEDFDSVISVHLKGTFNVSRAAATVFREQGSGAFVHMTSTSGLIGNFGQVNYGAAKLGIAGLSKCVALDMSRFGVRSNCISPFAWSRLIGTIPIADEAQAARVEKIKAMTPSKIAPVAIFLLSEDATDVTGQIFAVRNNEIFLMGQSRPLRSVQRNEGWTPETVAEHAHPAMKAHYYDLERSQDVFSWDPV